MRFRGFFSRFKEKPEVVFCKNCCFLETPQAAEGGGVLCKAAAVEYRDSWLEPIPFRAMPSVKNARNDCPDYKRKRA